MCTRYVCPRVMHLLQLCAFGSFAFPGATPDQELSFVGDVVPEKWFLRSCSMRGVSRSQGLWFLRRLLSQEFSVPSTYAVAGAMPSAN